MRAKHTAHKLPALPVYCSGFISENQLVVGGGGGAQTKSGIKNELRLYRVGDDRNIDLLDNYEFAKDEDAPMSLATYPKDLTFAAGINSSLEKLKLLQNENCRVFGLNQDDRFARQEVVGTLNDGDTDDYQKVTIISPDGTLVVVAGDNSATLLTYPSLIQVAAQIPAGKGTFYDATFSATTLILATTVNLLVYALPSVSDISISKTGKQKEISLKLLQTIEPPKSLGGSSGANFRGVRFHPQDDSVFYTIINTLPNRAKKQKSALRQGFVSKWSTKSWSNLKTRKVGDRGLTCFDISPNGNFLGFGSSDYTIGLLDSTSLSPLVTILKAHELPPTTLSFNPTSTLLVSGSADHTIRIMLVPDAAEYSWPLYFAIWIAILVVLFAVYAQQNNVQWRV